MPAIPVHPPTMSHPRFGTDFGVSAWQPLASTEPTAAEKAVAARNKIARELLPAIWAAERASGHSPIGFARMRHPDATGPGSSNFQDAGNGCVWVPPFHIADAISHGFELVDPVPDLGPADMLLAYVARTVEEGRIPAGFTAVHHPQYPGTSCSIDAYGPSIQRADGSLVVPHTALDAMMSHGFRPASG